MNAIIAKTLDTLNQTCDTTVTQASSTLNQSMDTTLTQTLYTLNQTIDTLNQTLSTQSSYDLFQFIVQFSILLILVCTFFIYKNTLKSQLLKVRYEMYLKTFDNVSDQEMKDFKTFPNSVLKRHVFNDKREYYAKDEKIRRYLTVSKLYEFLAFIYETKQLKLPNYLGDNWINKWTKDLLQENAFHDAHETNGSFYNSFSEFIEDQIKELPIITEKDFSSIEFSSPPNIVEALKANEVIHEKGYILNIELLDKGLMGLNEEQINRIKSILEDVTKKK